MHDAVQHLSAIPLVFMVDVVRTLNVAMSRSDQPRGPWRTQNLALTQLIESGGQFNAKWN